MLVFISAFFRRMLHGMKFTGAKSGFPVKYADKKQAPLLIPYPPDFWQIRRINRDSLLIVNLYIELFILVLVSPEVEIRICDTFYTL